ncbi:MAG: HAD family phosphatase [Butyrivibrio sp.]|nr:HAD family phosphatase [Butyrivibrio sp.]
MGKINMGKINTIIFDITGVLVDGCLDDFFRNKGYTEEMVQRLLLTCTNPGDWTEFDKNHVDLEGAIGIFARHDPEIEGELRNAFCDLNGIVRKRERTIPWIRDLKASGYKVLILSNFAEQGLEDNPFMKEFLDETDGGIISFSVGLTKPDPEIYRLLMERYELKAEECVFIDDMLENIEAAKALSMQGIVYKSYEQVIRELRKLGV